MSMDFEHCCLMVSFGILLTMEVSVLIGVGSCLLTIYSIVVRMTSPSHVFANNPPNSSSAANDI